MLWQNIDPYQHLQYYLSYYVFITGEMTSIYVCNPVILNTILCCLQLSAMSIMKRRTYEPKRHGPALRVIFSQKMN